MATPAWLLLCWAPLVFCLAAESSEGSLKRSCAALPVAPKSATGGDFVTTAGHSLLQRRVRLARQAQVEHASSNGRAAHGSNGSTTLNGSANQTWINRSLASAVQRRHKLSHLLDPNAADEPDTAPVWYVTLAIGVIAAIIVVFVMVIILRCLQLLVRLQEYLQQQLQPKPKPKASTSAGPVEAATPVPKETAPVGIEEHEVMALVNGDHCRLELLLAIAESADPSTMVEGLVQKGCQANSLKLSQAAASQIGQALVALAKAMQKIAQKRNASLTPREKLQTAMKQVLSMVRICRIMKLSIEDREGNAWTAAEAATEKYDEGAKPATQQNVKVAGQKGIMAYFASERWVDHAGITVIFVYSQLCGIVYAVYLRYRFPKMYDFMGPWILVSRGEAMSAIVLTVLMILLLTRGFMTFIRNHVGWSAVLMNIVDKHSLMHQWCGRMLPLCAVLHILGHFRGSLPAIVNEKDSSKINEVFTYGTRIKFNFNSWSGALRCYPAVTGYILVLILILFWSFSNEYVRRKSFELFHYPHLFLIAAWALGLWAHGARQWLGCGVPLGLLAVVPTVLFYFITRVRDIYRGKHEYIKIKNATLKKKTVLLEIDTQDSGYIYETGMYCMVKVPAISEFEWHPFTIASGGGSPVIQLLFAVVGDWTRRFKELLEEAQQKSIPYPAICLRGGYGAPAQGMRESKHVILVGAGVGATPFLSFLASFCQEAQDGVASKFAGIESAAFYWVSREPEDFVWVNRYNSLVQATPSLRDRLSIHLCLTKSLETTTGKHCSATEAAMFWLGAQVALNKFKAAELAVELGVPTNFGRPNWHQELRKHADALLAKKNKMAGGPAGPTCTGEHGELEINVFVCGNAMLVESLEKACDDLDDDEVIFRLFAEQF